MWISRKRFKELEEKYKRLEQIQDTQNNYLNRIERIERIMKNARDGKVNYVRKNRSCVSLNDYALDELYYIYLDNLEYEISVPFLQKIYDVKRTKNKDVIIVMSRENTTDDDPVYCNFIIDFTINAMAYNDDEGLIDPFGGLEDIEYKKIQCAGSAKDRFGEDALRILRAIRFASQLEFVMTPETSYEINKQYKNLKNISIERINSEFCKIAASRDFCVEMVLYKDVFALFIPELKDMFEFQQNNPYHDYDVYSHTVHSIEHCKSDNLVVRLAVFFHDIGKPHSFQDGEDGIRHFKGHGKVSADITDNIMKRLKFDNETRNNVVELVYYHDATFEVGKKYVRRWINKIGVEQFRRLLEVRKADILGQKESYEQYRINKVNNIKQILEEVLREETCFTLKDLAVNGNDLMSIGYKENKELGNTLNELLRLVIDEECPNKKEKLLEVAIERRM